MKDDNGIGLTGDLFADQQDALPAKEQLAAGTWLLRGFALPFVEEVLASLRGILRQAPFRQMVTPGGLTMAVALTNCGELGWISDRHGYRYGRLDPDSGEPWPAMPEGFLRLAGEAAAAAGYPGFVPDACLINRYLPGTRLSLHQDKNERDFAAPIVSVSLGVPAVFLFGGSARADKVQRIALRHGDVMVWGGEDRLRYHGVLALKEANHPLLGQRRINITLRKAG